MNDPEKLKDVKWGKSGAGFALLGAGIGPLIAPLIALLPRRSRPALVDFDLHAGPTVVLLVVGAVGVACFVCGVLIMRSVEERTRR